MEEWYETGFLADLSSVWDPFKMLTPEELHETWTFGHLSSYLFRS